MGKQCSGNGTIFDPVESVCNKLSKCYEVWDSLALTAWSKRRRNYDDQQTISRADRGGFGVLQEAWVDNVNELNVIKEDKKEKKMEKRQRKSKEKTGENKERRWIYLYRIVLCLCILVRYRQRGR